MNIFLQKILGHLGWKIYCVLRGVDFWCRKYVKPLFCCAVVHVCPLPPILTQFQIVQNYTHLSTFGIIILANYFCSFWLKHLFSAWGLKLKRWHYYHNTIIIIVDVKKCHQEHVVVECLGGDRRSIPLELLGARSRPCKRGSLLAPALSLTEVRSVDMKMALEALLGTGQLHPAIRQYRADGVDDPQEMERN